MNEGMRELGAATTRYNTAVRQVQYGGGITYLSCRDPDHIRVAIRLSWEGRTGNATLSAYPHVPAHIHLSQALQPHDISVRLESLRKLRGHLAHWRWLAGLPSSSRSRLPRTNAAGALMVLMGSDCNWCPASVHALHHAISARFVRP